MYDEGSGLVNYRTKGSKKKRAEARLKSSTGQLIRSTESLR
jgi:hypothetical protein